MEVTDRIEVTLAPHAALEAAISEYGEYVRSEVLADAIRFGESPGEMTIDLGEGHGEVAIELKKLR